MIGEHRTPDFANLRRTLLRRGPPGPVPVLEFLADVGFMERVLGERFPVSNLSEIKVCEREACERACDLIIQFHRHMGCDYVSVLVEVPLDSAYTAAGDTAVAGATRYWQDQSGGPIASWADFERYAWPSQADVNLWPLEYTARNLPDGMQVVAVCDGVFEWVKAMMGLETLALALLDEPELVAALCEKIGELTLSACHSMVQVPNLGACFFSDDMGHYTATLISPRHLRDYVFPWQKKLSEVVHAQGLPFLLHACGNLAAIMEELIEEVGIDGKHSFEDKIMPVEEVARLWGERIAILGGVDMDLLARGSEAQIRTRTRHILDACGPRGGYCLGTGNTVANYIPPGNYLAMLDEGRRWNQEHFGNS